MNSHRCYFRTDSGTAVVAAGGIRVCRMDDVSCCGLPPSLCLLLYDKNIKINHSFNVQVSYVMELHIITFTSIQRPYIQLSNIKRYHTPHTVKCVYIKLAFIYTYNREAKQLVNIFFMCRI